jgi:hypothetical protein
LPILAFVLVVDDVGVKYTDLVDLGFLVSALSPLYHVKAHPIADKFLRSTIHHDLAQRSLTVAYPGYIDALLLRLRPLGIKPVSTPALYTPPHYGSTFP